jgi:hypothetical protein
LAQEPAAVKLNHLALITWPTPRQQASTRRNRPFKFRLMLDQFRQTLNPKLDVANQLGREISRPQLAFPQIFPLRRGRVRRTATLKEESNFDRINRINRMDKMTMDVCLSGSVLNPVNPVHPVQRSFDRCSPNGNAASPSRPRVVLTEAVASGRRPYFPVSVSA